MARRSLSRLKADVAEAKRAGDIALAHYRLALFHDNNSREHEAIPHYLAALAHGLPPPLKAETHAWLASSYFKTGVTEAARAQAQLAVQEANDAKLRAFAMRLVSRIEKARANELQLSPLTR
jgi:hypothetical protein